MGPFNTNKFERRGFCCLRYVRSVSVRLFPKPNPGDEKTPNRHLVSPRFQDRCFISEVLGLAAIC